MSYKFSLNHNKPLVSVITPCYNDGEYIIECINSVANSTYCNIEHIIINDGSTDTYTLNILDQIRSKERVIVIDTINQGVCKARNQAIKKSKGKYILPVDGDDMIAPNYIKLAVKELEHNEKIKLIAAPYQLFGKTNKNQHLEPFSISKLLGHNLFITMSIFRRSDYDEIGGYNENMNEGLEDWDFWISLLEGGGDVKYLDGVQSYYRIKSRNKSRNANIDEKKHIRLRRQLWENHKHTFAKYFPDPYETFEYLNVASSKEYRLGKILLTPIRKILGL